MHYDLEALSALSILPRMIIPFKLYYLIYDSYDLIVSIIDISLFLRNVSLTIFKSRYHYHYQLILILFNHPNHPTWILTTETSFTVSFGLSTIDTINPNLVTQFNSDYSIWIPLAKANHIIQSRLSDMDTISQS
jgi:hypothetical protein